MRKSVLIVTILLAKAGLFLLYSYGVQTYAIAEEDSVIHRAHLVSAKYGDSMKQTQDITALVNKHDAIWFRSVYPGQLIKANFDSPVMVSGKLMMYARSTVPEHPLDVDVFIPPSKQLVGTIKNIAEEGYYSVVIPDQFLNSSTFDFFVTNSRSNVGLEVDFIIM